jgi:hypothetical protein
MRRFISYNPEDELWCQFCSVRHRPHEECMCCPECANIRRRDDDLCEVCDADYIEELELEKLEIE